MVIVLLLELAGYLWWSLSTDFLFFCDISFISGLELLLPLDPTQIILQYPTNYLPCSPSTRTF